MNKFVWIILLQIRKLQWAFERCPYESSSWIKWKKLAANNVPGAIRNDTDWRLIFVVK